MKTIYNKIYAALVFVALMSPTACVEKAPVYEPAEPVGNAEVYFASGLGTSYNLKNYDGTLNIEVKRVDTSAEIVVPVTVTADDVFTVPSSVKFLAGSASANVAISYDITKIEEAKEYQISIVIGSDTTPYGASSYECVVSVPAPWIKWDGDDGTKSGKIHFTEEFWEEEHTVNLLYYDDADGLRHCKIAGDDACDYTYSDGSKCAGGVWGNEADFEFTWNTETNKIDVPKQVMFYNTRYGANVYVYGWYEYLNIDSQYAGSWNDSATFYEQYGEYYPQSYYDGNGGFYFNLVYFMPGVGGWDNYEFDVVGIADGFVRTEDYNDDDHIGASSPLYDGEAESMFFASDTTGTSAKFETQMRYDASYLDDVKEGEEVAEGTTTTYYLKDYFAEGYGLAFTAPAPELLANGSKISDVENEQFTGIAVFGSAVYVNIWKGSFTFEEGEEFPTANIILKVYSKDDEGNKVYDFGQVEEKFVASGAASVGSQFKFTRKSGIRASASYAVKTFSLSPREKGVKTFPEISFE